MGGEHITGVGTGDDSFDDEGYDESQRAEILEATRDGPTDGTILTDLDPDLSDDTVEDEPLDELDMTDDELGETDDDVDMDEADIDEDALQDDFDEDDLAEDELGDGNDAALRP